MNIVSDRDGFVWKGHDQLTPRVGTLSLAPGFQPHALLQLHPPAAITALVLHAEWGLIAAGTAHGLALFDYIRHKGVLTKCTLNPNGKLCKYVAVLKICHRPVSLKNCIYITIVWCCFQRTWMCSNSWWRGFFSCRASFTPYFLYCQLFVVCCMLVMHNQHLMEPMILVH